MSQAGILNMGGIGPGGSYISLTPFIVGKPGDMHAGFFTIQSAITAAVAAGASSTTPANVYIKPGTYTENPTLADGVNLVGFGSSVNIPSTIINGKCSGTYAGNSSISGLCLQTNGDFAISITGTNQTYLDVTNCSFISVAGQTNINLTSTGGSLLEFYNCTDNIVGNHGSNLLFQLSTAGLSNTIRVFNCFFNGTVPCTVGGGSAVQIYNSEFGYPVTTSGTAAFSIVNSIMTGTLSIGGTAGNNNIYNSQILAGAATCLAIGAGAQVYATHTAFSTSNVAVISGAGELRYALLSFFGSSSGVTVTTTTPLPTLI